MYVPSKRSYESVGPSIAACPAGAETMVVDSAIAEWAFFSVPDRQMFRQVFVNLLL